MYSRSSVRVEKLDMASAEPRYEIEFKNEDYEIRLYSAVLVAETIIEDAFEAVGKKAFRILADYIFGQNNSKTKIAMSVPVMTQPNFGPNIGPSINPIFGQGFKVQFALLDGFNVETAPQPLDSRVQVHEISPRRMAALAYSGSWSEENFKQHLDKLLVCLERDHLKTLGLPIIAKYNSPFQPSFLRRNEVLIEVQR